MKQFLVCWDRDIDSVWVYGGGKWRYKHPNRTWIDSGFQTWDLESFKHVLKVNNFKEK